MRKTLFCLFANLLSLAIAYAQKDLREGYIISTNFDTISGYIDYRGDIYNSTKCIFFKQKDSEQKDFLPGNIFAYRFKDGRFYVSKEIKRDNEKKTVFLEYLVNGITNLYYYKDINGEHYYIQKGNELIELTNNLFIARQGYNDYYTETNQYKGILTYVYSDAKGMIPFIEHASFTRESMINLSKQYHGMVCKDSECIIYEKKIKNILVEMGPIVKYEFLTTKYKGFLEPFNLRSEPTLQVGIAANLKLLSLNEKLNLGIKLLYDKEMLNGQYSRQLITNIEKNYLNIERNKITTSFDLRYEYPKGKFRPVAGCGIDFGIVVSQKRDYSQKIFEPAGTLLSEIKNTVELQKYIDSSLIGLLGFSHKIMKNDFIFEVYVKKGLELYQETHHYNVTSYNRYTSQISAFGIITGVLF